MESQYFQVKRDDSPEANGVVVKVHDGKLELIAGEHLEAGLDPAGKLCVPHGYFYFMISEGIAKKLQEDYLSLEIIQSYASDVHPINIISTPGLREKGTLH